MIILEAMTPVLGPFNPLEAKSQVQRHHVKNLDVRFMTNKFSMWSFFSSIYPSKMWMFIERQGNNSCSFYYARRPVKLNVNIIETRRLGGRIYIYIYARLALEKQRDGLIIWDRNRQGQ